VTSALHEKYRACKMPVRKTGFIFQEGNLKKLLFIFMMAVVLVGFIPAQEGSSAAQEFPPSVVLFGNIAEFCDVTPDTVSIAMPLYAEITIDIIADSFSFIIKFNADEYVSLSKTLNTAALDAIYFTIGNNFITGGLPLRGA